MQPTGCSIWSVNAVPLSTFRQEWPLIVKEQGRKLTWLASRTGRAVQTVHSYSNGTRRPPDEWLRAAAAALCIEVE